MKHYQVVAAVVELNSRILCTKKGLTRYSYTSNHWEFPGGKIEEGETPQQALCRELLEELDCEVTVGEEIITVTHQYPDFIITLHAYQCTAQSPYLILQEHIEYKWQLPTELPSMEWCDADLPIVKAVCEQYHASQSR